MLLYTFQDETITKQIENMNNNEALWVDFQKTNLYKQANGNLGMIEQQFTAYKYMADKLAEKTGIKATLKGKNISPLPWWAWYKVDGKEQKPSMEYSMGGWNSPFEYSKQCLITLNVPEEIVLLSDINAFYSCLRGEPCFDYLSEKEEKKAWADYEKKIRMLTKTHNKEDAEKLYAYTESTWENIFIVDGSRRLREVKDIPLPFKIVEKHDIQAVFPFILKNFVVNIE